MTKTWPYNFWIDVLLLCYHDSLIRNVFPKNMWFPEATKTKICETLMMVEETTAFRTLMCQLSEKKLRAYRGVGDHYSLYYLLYFCCFQYLDSLIRASHRLWARIIQFYLNFFSISKVCSDKYFNLFYCQSKAA